MIDVLELRERAREFSEDLDFTLLEGAPATDDLREIFGRIADRLYDASGIEIPREQLRFDVYETARGARAVQGRVYYRGPRRPGGDLPRIKIDLTGDEVLVYSPIRRAVTHPYTDVFPTAAEPLCYPLPELFGEKLRALAERCLPRDLVANWFWGPLRTADVPGFARFVMMATHCPALTVNLKILVASCCAGPSTAPYCCRPSGSGQSGRWGRRPSPCTPIPDLHPPKVEQAGRVVDLAVATARAGKNVIIHCRGGRGRAGTLGACCYVAFGRSPSQAVAASGARGRAPWKPLRRRPSSRGTTTSSRRRSRPIDFSDHDACPEDAPALVLERPSRRWQTSRPFVDALRST